MARRRMFSLELISSDRFLGLRPTAQSFYFHLNMHADDEGFVSAPRSLGMLCGGTNEDLKSLEEVGYIICFESGVVVITHWLLNNTIRKDRSIPTIHRTEKAMLSIKDNLYVLNDRPEMAAENDTDCMTEILATNLTTKEDTVFSAKSAPQNRIENNRKEYIIVDNNRSEEPGGENADPVLDGLDKEAYMIPHIEPSITDITEFVDREGLNNIDCTQFWAHYYVKKWRDRDGKPIRDWKALARSWNAENKKRNVFYADPAALSAAIMA